VEFTTKRVAVRPAAPKRNCSILFTNIRGSFRFEFKSCRRSCTGLGIALFTASDTGPNTAWFAVRILRFVSLLGFLTDSDTSVRAPTHALRSSGNSHTAANLPRFPARRMYLLPLAGQSQVAPRASLTRDTTLAAPPVQRVTSD